MTHLQRSVSGFLAVCAIAAFTGSAARAAAVLDIVETPGDGYTITALDDVDPAIQYWRCKVDAASGCIYSFVDLTDAGDGAGGHTDLLDNGGYNRKCSLLLFYGRGTQVLSRSALDLADMTAHLSFTAAPDGSSFEIRYGEDETSTAYFQNAYGSDAIALTPGDLLSTITVTIRPPGEEGTFWDWRIDQENVSDHGIDPRVWAKQEVRSYIHGGIPKTLDSDTSDANGPWNPAAPMSFARWTLDANTLGLTAGRQVIVDYDSDVTLANGNAVASSSWAGFDFLQYKAAYDQPPAAPLAAGATRSDYGRLIIDITSTIDLGAPQADAGPDQVLTDADRSGDESITLDGSGSLDPDGTLVSYRWTENDIEIATGVSPAVTLVQGLHEIVLTVTDDDGKTDQDTVTVNITDPDYNEPPTAEAGPNRNVVDSDDNGSEVLVLDGSGSTDSDGTIVSYVWTQNAIEIGAGATLSHTFDVGTWTVMLTVTDDDDATATDLVTITVTDPNPNTLPLPQPDPESDLPESLPIDTTSNQLFNTYGQTITGTRPTDLIWPANPGEAHLCAWADDKFAAASITIDDMNRPDHSFWLQQAQLHDIKLTWFIIPAKLADYTGAGSSISLYGYWSTFEDLYNQGHDVQSHSMTHTDNQHLEPTYQLHYEYGVSKQLIEQYIPGNQCLTMAYPWGEGRETVAAQYFTACRGTVGGTNIPYQTNYLRTRCASTSIRPVTDVILTGSGDLSWSNPIYKRGWAVFLFHGVGDYAATAGDLAYLMSFADQIWIDTFKTISTYGQQRDTATLTVTAADASAITFTLTDRMMDSIYNLPLTVKVKLYPEWNGVTAIQDGQPLETAIVTHDGERYALIKVVPDRGPVTLTDAPAALGGDANGDGNVDIQDFVILKQNYGTAGGAAWSQGDFNADGNVDIQDFVILKQNYGLGN